ncbi:MAG: NUDIX domain-containing protein [Zetaproteobacteria bacterium]|nr:NUDIX domain-containing protein [Zetaproteobacteria bacterium]
MKFTINKQTPLYRGFFALDAFDIEHECFDGGTLNIRREHLERGDAIAVVLYDPAIDAVLLIEQFRIGAAVHKENPWMIEIVAGMIDAGSNPEQTVRREAMEEAGYEVQTLKHLGSYFVSPGGCSEKIELYLGTIDHDESMELLHGLDHEGEDIRTFWLPRAEAMQWVLQGKITSGAPMLGLLLAFGCEGAIKSSDQPSGIQSHPAYHAS